ncbi:hypothetical protein IKW73_02170 [Candidatus Saccharibacteria bacterium]|nr:hypothetical protein [Candidatus Saccharibacteria bacterium]
MFFDDVKNIEKIAAKTGTSIFVMPDDKEVEIKNALTLEPNGKTVISIEQARDIISRLSVKQTSDQFVVIRPVEAMSEEAANAFLKNLEEPGEKVHFVLITSSPSLVLPTILSRSSVYFLRNHEPIDGDIKVEAKIRDLAKRLIVAKPGDWPALAEEITKKKENVREYTLTVLATTIEMLYKSYFKTGKEIFIKKIPKFLTAYENIEKNGHIKLHLVADCGN